MQYVDDSLLVLSQLINNKVYFKRIMHHIEPKYFDFDLDRRIFKFIKNYSDKYKEAPTPLVTKNALSNLDLSNESHEQYINEFVKLIEAAEIVPLEPMLDKTEIFIKEMELKVAVMEAASIYKGESKLSPESLPELFKTALSKSIEDDHGDFYFDEECALARLESYNSPESKVKFKLKKFNDVTNNGVTTKALHCFVAGPNVGKTATLIALASDYIECGNDVLYITLEMSRAQIGIRFDARLLNYETDEIPKLNPELYKEKVRAKKESCGRLIIKEYPTNELTAQKLEILLDELETKFNYRPKVVMIDYMGICSSYLLKERNNIGIYYTKVAEEFRAAAQRKDIAIWTAMQMTTESLDSTDPTLKNISYGQGIAKTSDMVWFGIRTEELDAKGQLLIKQEKTRYHKERIVRFCVTFDIGRMKLSDAEIDAIPISASLNTGSNFDKPKISTAFNKLKEKQKLNVS